jgi:hypothetical protein
MVASVCVCLWLRLFTSQWPESRGIRGQDIATKDKYHIQTLGLEDRSSNPFPTRPKGICWGYSSGVEHLTANHNNSDHRCATSDC